MSFPSLASRLEQVRETIARHKEQGGWKHEVRIVAVTKGHPADAVHAALAAGLTDVGENRVQEALRKQDELGALPVEWHLIGTLQRNKARHAAGRFALIHSVDSVELAHEVARRTAAGSRQAVLLQVNCSGEPQKGGVEPEALPELLEKVTQESALDVRGLMTMAAFDADEATVRRTFGHLRTLRDDAVHHVGAGLARPLELSMGMSGDYAVAVEEGATMVRLGTVLFGERGG